jgi:DNA helicase-2/ATP-dependent DNA helicase PcrA
VFDPASDRLAGLNPAQRSAATTLSGPLLVLAGAGTGKTRVITVRMAELIRHGVAPDRILSVTFTNKAAKEMLERTTHLLGRRMPKRPFISTFHSLCVKVLRDEIEALEYPKNFTIYARGDQESAARTALRDVRLDEKQLKPSDFLFRVSKWKTAGILPQHAKDHVTDDVDFLAAVAYRRYQQNLRSCGAVDFDDLLLLTNRLFKEHPAALKRTQDRFSHVQIDEYQDTNGLQFELIEALVRPHRNLCVVGDDDQSIYGWRGADVEHILGFAQHFPGAKVVRLEANYRCTDKILNLANTLVRQNRSRHHKTLFAAKTGAEVRILDFPDEQSEAERVVAEIEYWVNHKQVPPDDLCILFRTNEQPRIFETELRRKKLRYVLIGGQSFFDRREVKDILSYLKVLSQPADEVSLRRIINVPPRGIGEATVEKLLARAVRAKTSLWDAAPSAVRDGDITAKAAAAIRQFHDLLERYRRAFRDRPREMDKTLEAFLTEIDYEAEIERQYKNEQQQMVRAGMLEQVVNAVSEYISHESKPTLEGFLDDSTLNGGDDFGGGKDDQLQEKGVRLMTLHSAKGLEFPRVYLVGLEEGILPHKRSIDAGERSQIEEERRLCYVGITRAQTHLTITRSSSRMKWGKRRQSLPSRFLHEMQQTEATGETPAAEHDE